MPETLDTQTQSTNQTDNTSASAQPSAPVKPDFGNGRYSPLMEEVYNDAQVVFGITPVQAEKLARGIATELGAIMASAPVEVRLGKLSKDGKLTIAEASKLKGFTLTYNIAALRALHYAGDAGKHGFSFGATKWRTAGSLAKMLSEL